MGGPDPAQAVLQRRAGREVELAGRERGRGQMEMRVGQAGDRHLVRLELEAFR